MLFTNLILLKNTAIKTKTFFYTIAIIDMSTHIILFICNIEYACQPFSSDLVIHQIKMTVDLYILRDYTKIGHLVGLG
ncbi:MAG TPA: hypothetical protein DDW42_02715 [Desulfobacteraceae bacterium]|nr:hypothetical protein [Desulfobacteraceae bacterium]